RAAEPAGYARAIPRPPLPRRCEPRPVTTPVTTPSLGPSAPAASLPARVRIVLEMIKIEHTLFALPFAFLGMLLAAEGLPSWRTIGWIVVAMVGARSAAMAFNRLADRHIDAANPRTAGRALPAG